MAVYSVTHHQRLDNYVVVQLLTASDIEVGQSVTLAGLGHGLAAGLESGVGCAFALVGLVGGVQPL